ncbi:DNA-directed RNA polymerase subunit M/transcription elongation factor TFIIS [Peribacillus simplex]|uniref:PIN domain-containing protein n=1 Tax=Peribacillus simplex TaxID=1478 RepID=UPI0024E1C181|nr:PIN domain-containing protein [Peribacillus simplex]MDF9761379.1 DNA-directed RNA polymerase subunit M/transcription elongation factor TFIIS [Peribacillus simplex]
MDRYELISRLTKDNKYFRFQENQYSKRNKKDVKIETVDGKVIQQVLREKEIFLFIDTCTWLNHASKGDFENFVRIADLHLAYDSILLVPDQLTIEWNRNKKEKVYQVELNSINDIIRKTMSFRDKIVMDQAQKEQLSELISQAEQFKTKQVEYIGQNTISVVEDVMKLGHKIPTEDNIKIEAANWGLLKHPPFHKDKNSTGDTILFLSLVNYLEKASEPILYFVTDNKTDFSESKEQPHEMQNQLLSIASEKGITIKYFLRLKDALDGIIEEVTDEAYVKECKRLYEESIPKCPKCSNTIVRDLHSWDGHGQKIFYKCTKCPYTEETGTYKHEEAYDQYY